MGRNEMTALLIGMCLGTWAGLRLFEYAVRGYYKQISTERERFERFAKAVRRG